MKKWLLIPFMLLLLVGCRNTSYERVAVDESFIASINILQPSIQFFNAKGEELANWPLDKAYSGATLLEDNKIVLYGNQLDEIVILELSTGKEIHTLETPIGTTNSYYDETSKQLFVANSKTNLIYCYNEEGEFVRKVKVHNYPMSMTAYKGLLYVVNYKDTLLSVIDVKTLKVIDEWNIASSSHGLWIDEESQQLWLGGHGEGSKPNDTVDIFNLTTGELISQLELPMMPIAFAADGTQQAVVSHGNSMLYILQQQQIVQQQKVSANPFAVQFFEGRVVVAGYDDATLYMIEDGEIALQIASDKGPFQLLVREVK